MREKRKFQDIDNLIDKELSDSFGLGDDELLEVFECAAAEPDDPELVPPDGEFEKIIAQVDLAKKSKKVVRLKNVAKAGLLVAVLGCVLLGTGIGASGKRGFEYSIRKLGNGCSVWSNSDNIPADNELEEAYTEIEDRLGINVLELIYMPEGMEFTNILFGNGYARLEYTWDNQYVYVIQSQKPIENSGCTASDRIEKEDVYNKKLNMKLFVDENILLDNRIELSTEFKIDNSYYYIVGIIYKDEFKQIISTMNCLK